MKKLYFLIPIVIFVLLVGVSEFRLSMGNTKHFDFGDKFWIHRGGVPENSIEGINAALSRGFHGIEIDVFFNESSRQFVVSHDKPTDQTFLTLERVLKEFKETPLKLWIDYKNSDLKHFIKAKNRLKELVLKYGFESRLFIESPHALHQWLLSWSGLNASMWVRGFEKSRIQFLMFFIVFSALLQFFVCFKNVNHLGG